MAINNFEQLELSQQLMRGLNKMGFQTPTQVQEAAVGPMLEGKDLLVQAPTGTGKTCAFGIPVVEMADPNMRKIQTVILCPTRELAIQTANVLKNLMAFKPGVKVQAIYGGEPIQRQIYALRRKPQIVVATPGRLMDHMKRRTVRLDAVTQVVLDEADRMLDMGFRDDIATILQSVPEDRQTVLFSATLSAEIKQIAARYQQDVQSIKIQQPPSNVTKVEQFYSKLQSRAKMSALLELLTENKFGLALVFVATKSMADQLAARLSEQGIRADALHGDLRQRQRDVVMDRYRKRKINVLVATDVAARGIDVYNIDAVINYDIPGDADSYIHRIGRTGRADQTGAAYTFVSNQEYRRLMSFVDQTQSKIIKLQLGPEPVEQAGERRGNSNNNSKPHWQKRRKPPANRGKRYNAPQISA